MSRKISPETVKADFNEVAAVLHYTRAAHELGLWKSERLVVGRFFPDRGALLLEAGCGAGRATLGLWEMGYRSLAAFDFAEELLDQARSLAANRGADGIGFFHADATALPDCAGMCGLIGPGPVADALRLAGGFGGALFLFNGLMQIPGRERRREALRRLVAACRPGAPLVFTTHDRNASRTEQALWRLEAVRWEKGLQDPRLNEFGDRYFEDEAGRTFMHLPDRTEILDDLAETGWRHDYDALRRQIAAETRAVRDFSDECRFWAATRA